MKAKYLLIIILIFFLLNPFSVLKKTSLFHFSLQTSHCPAKPQFLMWLDSLSTIMNRQKLNPMFRAVYKGFTVLLSKKIVPGLS